MSAWSDWQCGAITENEYRNACRREEILDYTYWCETMGYISKADEEDDD